MIESQDLLEAYVKTGSEPAFRELLSRYIDLVYSTAVRLVDGDTHRAQDVAQIVFSDLARMASKLTSKTLLGGWLHRHTCFVARTVMRGERRRQHRERQAAEMNSLDKQNESGLAQIAPILDEAINELAPDDREAVLLRFFERRNLRSVGEALGISENVAQKRVSRALDELEVLLRKRGIALTATALAGGLGAAAVTAAPTGLATAIAGSIFGGAGAAGGLALATAKAAAATKLKVGIVAAMLLLWVSSVLFLQIQFGGKSSNAAPSFPLQLEGSKAESAPRRAILAQEFAPRLHREAAVDLRPREIDSPATAPLAASIAVNTPVENTKVRAPIAPGAKSPFEKAIRLDARSGSKVRIEGTSNLHDWQVESPLILGFMEVGPGFPYEPQLTNQTVFAHAEATVMVRQLRSVDQDGKYYSDKMDNTMWTCLRMNEHPKISYSLRELVFIGITNAPKPMQLKFESIGELVIAGVTNEITMPILIQPEPKEKLRIFGSAKLKMTAFKIRPPDVMPKVDDEVKLKLEWVVGSDKGGSAQR